MKVLISGGSGFLERAIMHYEPSYDYTVYSRDERKQELCKQAGYDAKYVLGDVRDRDRLLYNMKDHDLVIHTAAVKYIPEAEYNVNECIDVNVQGSRNILWAAQLLDIPVIGVSTDKAVQPVSVYGASKMLMERLFVEAHRNGLLCWTVRYGNVVGSTGSVIPLFQQQLATKGYITLTDPFMTRYWMAPSKAVEVVLSPIKQHFESGYTIVAPLGSTNLLTIAEYVLDQHGTYKDEAEEAIHIIGMRPGEKKYESLLHEHEAHRAIKVGDYYLIHPNMTAVEPGPIFSLRSDSEDALWLTGQDIDSMMQEAGLLNV